MQKFVENDHEKVERLMELHFKYVERVNKADEKIEQKKRVSAFLLIYYSIAYAFELQPDAHA